MNEITAETKKKLEQQMIEQFCDVTCSFDLAVTLTFTKEPKSLDVVERDFRHFMNQLNSDIFGRNWRAKSEENPDQRIAVIPTHEDDYGKKQIHYHCAFATPSHLRVEDFAMKIGSHWSCLRNGSKKHNKAKRIYDSEGWIEYILKEVNVLSPDDNIKIDVLNMHTY